MANMSYCRFQNTVGDLQDCWDNIDAGYLSEEEKSARERLIKICVDVALDYGHEVGKEVQECE